MHMKYQVTHCGLTLSSVFSGGQLNLGEHDSTETEYGYNKSLILQCLFTEPTHASLLLSSPEL